MLHGILREVHELPGWRLDELHNLFHLPDPWADPKNRSTLGFCDLHHRSIRAQNWGIYFLDPSGGLSGMVKVVNACLTYAAKCLFWEVLEDEFRGLSNPDKLGLAFATLMVISQRLRRRWGTDNAEPLRLLECFLQSLHDILQLLNVRQLEASPGCTHRRALLK